MFEGVCVCVSVSVSVCVEGGVRKRGFLYTVDAFCYLLHKDAVVLAMGRVKKLQTCHHDL